MGLARAITQFRRNEIISLLKAARPILRIQEFDIRAASSSLDHGRFLIIIPRAVGNSPERNLLRRRLKSIFYEEKMYLLPYDFVIYIKKEAKKLSFDQLKRILLDVKDKLISKDKAN